MTTILWQLVSFILMAGTCLGMIEEIQTPTNIQNCYNRYSRNTRLTRSVGDIINWICVQRNVIRAPSRSDLMLSNASYSDLLWWNDLVQSVDPMFNIGKSHGPIRIRKEYRRLSDMERFRFHAAIKTLKQIPLIQFDVLEV
ncbi:hypothetical protein KUTeg_018843 [Tegillarca granosa]|uniref:Uncharacterized protein n=1 Tax=Tegillarca granosa TaxID=220873 RepID=A0ABQ9EEX3_TEGGR|nr:hypothetical protein KUTeg_018843 [Tegillarca granosa]